MIKHRNNSVIIYLIKQLLKEERFLGIDKIKTVGSTYMAVVGLIPGMSAIIAIDSSL